MDAGSTSIHLDFFIAFTLALGLNFLKLTPSLPNDKLPLVENYKVQNIFRKRFSYCPLISDSPKETSKAKMLTIGKVDLDVKSSG